MNYDKVEPSSPNLRSRALITQKKSIYVTK